MMWLRMEIVVAVVFSSLVLTLFLGVAATQLDGGDFRRIVWVSVALAGVPAGVLSFMYYVGVPYVICVIVLGAAETFVLRTDYFVNAVSLVCFSGLALFVVVGQAPSAFGPTSAVRLALVVSAFCATMAAAKLGRVLVAHQRSRHAAPVNR
jgi:hypothetical protein